MREENSMNQEDRLLDYLETHKGINPLTAWQQLGIYRLSACVHTLRKRGNPIITERIGVDNRFNEKCNVAFYRLVKS